MGKKSSSELCDCFLCFQTCVLSCVVMLKEDFSNMFVRSETLLQGFETLNLRI